MTTQTLVRHAPALLLSLTLAAGCAGSDNPTALADVEADVEFEIEATELQTLEEVEFVIHAREGGMHMDLTDTEMEIQHEDGGDPRTVTMEREGDGYAAHVTFFEAGEHHLHFRATPRRHAIMGEMGDMEVHVMRRYEIAGPYRIEIETDPHGPLLEGATAHIHIHVFEVLADGTPGDEVAGLSLTAEVHTPDEEQAVLTVTEEEAGEYETEYTFDHAGLYELHVEIDLGTEEVGAEFHIPIFSEDTSAGDTTGGQEGGHGHGN
jgi:hypothetical protein